MQLETTSEGRTGRVKAESRDGGRCGPRDSHREAVPDEAKMKHTAKRKKATLICNRCQELKTYEFKEALGVYQCPCGFWVTEEEITKGLYDGNAKLQTLLLIDRISLNGHRYIAAESRSVIERICEMKGIPQRFIRYSEKHGKYYLRLWGRWKDV
jgi:hypothetical protein